MSNRYVFKAINDEKCAEYCCEYTQGDAFYFSEDTPYFSMISTEYDGSSYGNAYVKGYTNFNATRDDIIRLLEVFNIKVDLYVERINGGNLILPLTKTDSNYAYFSNGELSLKVDVGGAVTDVTDGGEPGK